jgi:hypothetical protein
MTTGEGADGGEGPRNEHPRDERERRPGERIGVGGGDDSVTRIQLAARWAESYGPPTDKLGNILKRFRAAYEYLDAVTHGVEPPELEEELAETRQATQPVPAPAYAPPQPESEPAPPSPPPAAPHGDPRPWS